MSASYWITFSDRKSGCFEGDRAEVETAAARAGTVTSIDVIPYPATPREGPSPSTCPAFCYTPERCRGRTSCPHGPACSE